jgi:hypothetical protein
MVPQFAPTALQLVGVHDAPHRLGPVPPHTPVFGQLPQLRAAPQPSLTQPHDSPLHACASVFAVQVGWPQTLGAPPPPQVSGAVHDPQLMVPPQPSETRPQFFWLHALLAESAEQPPGPHRFGPPPPQKPLLQLPQLYVPPQPSLTSPHEFAGQAVASAIWTQPPQMPGEFKPQTCPPPQVPQPSAPCALRAIPPQPSANEPQLYPSEVQLAGVHCCGRQRLPSQ